MINKLLSPRTSAVSCNNLFFFDLAFFSRRCNLSPAATVITVENIFSVADLIKKKTIRSNVAVIGGGLSGLTAANYLARAGFSVTLFEKSRSVGGRARTDAEQGFHFNLGPHALYAGGAAIGILRELGVRFHGKSPATSGGFAIDRGVKHTLPVGRSEEPTTEL